MPGQQKAARRRLFLERPCTIGIVNIGVIDIRIVKIGIVRVNRVDIIRRITVGIVPVRSVRR